MNFEGSKEYSSNEQDEDKGLEQMRQKVEEISDKLGEGVDENIKESVVAFMAHEFPTSQSCEGHIGDKNVTAPWVEVYAPEIKGFENNEEKEKEWTIENLKQQKRMLEMLDEFYQDRKIHFDAVLSFRNIGAYGGFRVQSTGAEIMPILPFEEQKSKLNIYRNEMKEFTEFLKNKLKK